MRKLTTQEFIKKAKEVHGSKYIYDKVNYKNTKSKVVIQCKVHGYFEQEAGRHIYGAGCFKCSHVYVPTNSEFIEKANKIHGGFYNYDKTRYIKAHKKVIITCPTHGDFLQTPTNHITGFGCVKCGILKSKTTQTSSTQEFIDKSKSIHEEKYNYDLVEYVNAKEKVKIVCPEHGEFEQIPNNHLRGYECPKCSSWGRSKSEIKLYEYVKNSLADVISNHRSIEGVSEVDIFVPSKKIAIEYNGLYWHSDKFKDKNYHLNKTQLCEKQGVKLIHIFEDEWVDKETIVKSRLANLLGVTPNKIYGRKTKLKEIEWKLAKKFLDCNHIQGRGAPTKINIALYEGSTIVALMTFGKKRIATGNKHKEGHYELYRYCNVLNTTVLGGASKCLKYFEKTYKPKEVTSYADRRWSQGDLYYNLGFSLGREGFVNYYYIIQGKREHRYKFTKSKLVKQGFDKNKTERQIMEDLGHTRVYDSGSFLFVKKYLH